MKNMRYILAGIGTFIIANLISFILSNPYREILQILSILPLMFMVGDIMRGKE